MRTFRLFETISVAIWLSCTPVVRGDEHPPTWKAIETEILASKMLESPTGTVKRHWTNSHSLLLLVKNGQSGALIRLATVSTNPMVSLSAYYALRQLETESKALDLGLALSLRDDVTNFFPLLAMGQVIEDHTNGVSVANVKNALSRTVRLQNINSKSAALLVDRLSPRLLQDWFEDASRPSANVDFEAFVTQRLVREARKQQKPLPSKLTATIESYARLPGVPRYVYLMWAEPTTAPNFKELLKSVLEDPSMPIEHVMSLAHKKSQFIKTNLDLRVLQIDEYRMELIEQELAR